ncbi:hypothetical protein [Streptomyces sp. NPDC048357]|uniref:hypothetical protein n=1 Tax=Streptomyces sp. NPDC048357 TaxID=3154719 RepID=UPI00341814BD
MERLPCDGGDASDVLSQLRKLRGLLSACQDLGQGGGDGFLVVAGAQDLGGTAE